MRKRMLGYFSQKASDSGYNIYESEDDPMKFLAVTSVVPSGWSPMSSIWKDEKFVGYLGDHVESHRKLRKSL